MPIETAQFPDTLQSDWPLGTDPESGGDDHIRMVKQVIKNTLPNINGAITGTPEQINNITLNTPWLDNSATAGALSNFNLTDPSKTDGSLAALALATPSMQDLNLNTALAITWRVIQDIVYPVKRVIASSDPRNPVEYLGFGTWEARSGTIYGVGEVADQNGYTVNIGLGNHNADAFWRVQNGHIVAAPLTVTLTMDPVPDHEHPAPVGASQAGNFFGAGSTGDMGIAQTNAAGGHTPTGTGSTTIGSGGMADGAVLLSPGWACYVWERTA